MTYRVRQADVTNVRQILKGIWQRSLAVGKNIDDHHAWYYEQNPAGSGATFLLEHATNGKKQKTVGSTDVILRRFYVHGEPLTAGMLCNVAVDPAHRTLFPALMLQRAARSYGAENLGFIYGFPNKHALPLYERMKISRLGHMVRYTVPLSIKEYVERKVNLPPLLNTAVDTADKFRRLADVIQARIVPRDCTLIWPTDVDERFDQLWARSRNQRLIMAQRDADFLRWRFLKIPETHFEIAALSCPRIEAYAVIQCDKRRARIADIFGSSEQYINRLVTMLLPALRERGVHVLTMRFFGAQWLVSLLRRHGFRAHEDKWPIIVDPAQCSPKQRQKLSDTYSWYLTDGDDII